MVLAVTEWVLRPSICMVLGPEDSKVLAFEPIIINSYINLVVLVVTKWVLRPSELHGTRTRRFQSVGVRAHNDI